LYLLYKNKFKKMKLIKKSAAKKIQRGIPKKEYK